MRTIVMEKELDVLEAFDLHRAIYGRKPRGSGPCKDDLARKSLKRILKNQPTRSAAILADPEAIDAWSLSNQCDRKHTVTVEFPNTMCDGTFDAMNFMLERGFVKA